MIRPLGEQRRIVNEQMRGGDGSVVIEHLLESEKGELYGKGRLYARVTLGPGCSIGEHVHENEMESFAIVSGRARYLDGDREVVLNTGDLALCPPGGRHSVACEGDEACVLIAQILFE